MDERGRLMGRFLIVESRDLMEYKESDFALSLASQLKKSGNETTLFLIENGVLAARKGSEPSPRLTALSKEGVKVLAEDLSLKLRGVKERAEGVSESNMEALADLILTGADKVIWY